MHKLSRTPINNLKKKKKLNKTILHKNVSLIVVNENVKMNHGPRFGENTYIQSKFHFLVVKASPAYIFWGYNRAL